MLKYFENLANALMGVQYNELNQKQQNVIQSIANQETLSSDINESFHEQLTIGQRVADKVAAFGGSWTFIILFIVIMLVWMGINTWWLIGESSFDPYPFILLNLVLSSLAALQAPIIMMSQNRQTSKDRFALAQNYKISLKTELEIMRLHQKIDELSSALVKNGDTDAIE